jgi:pimeloyl-[acyl-carrier protein] methyl ester esterase
VSGALHVESSGSGPPLVLLHGWAMHSGVWGPLVPALALRHRVHAVDLPGHGGSAAVPPTTLDALVDAVAAGFAAEAEPVTVIGWSLGGMAALRWARRAPRQVRRLALVATTPSFIARADWPHAMAADTLAQFGDELRVSYRLTLQRFLSLQLAGGREGRVTRGTGTVDGRATLAALRRGLFARGEPSPAALAGALAILTDTDLRAEVPAIAQPCLVVSGERDTLTPAAAGAWLASALPAGRLVEIAGAGHVPFLSHPAEFMRALDAFIDEPEGPPRGRMAPSGTDGGAQREERSGGH